MIRTIQSLLFVVVASFTFPAAADKSADIEAFKAAYSAYQQYEESQDYQHAMPEAKTAYELGRKIYGKKHENTAALAYNYGLTLIELGDADETRKVLKEAVTLHEAVYGKNSEELIPVLMDLGHAYAMARNLAKQKKSYNRALKIARNHYGADSARYGHLLLDAGIEILDEARSAQAKTYLEDAYQVLRDALGDEDSSTGYAAFQLGRFEFAAKEFADAEGHLLAALNTFEDPDHPSNPVEMSTHAWLVSVYEELGESEKATAHCQAIGRMSPIHENQDYLPLFRKAPRYPTLARKSGQEGYVDLDFTVDHEGIVRNPVVIKVKGSDGFVNPSIEAVKAFRYAPRFVEGQAVATPGVTIRLTFQFSN